MLNKSFSLFPFLVIAQGGNWLLTLRFPFFNYALIHIKICLFLYVWLLS